MTVENPPAVHGRRVSRGWLIVATFGITQTIGYGCLYYSFAVLLHPIATGLHTSPAAVTGAFTTAILAWAAMAIPVGRLLDRHGGRALMTGGSLAGALLLVGWAHVHSLWQLYLVLAALGAAMAMALYDTAIAVVVSWFTPDVRPRAVLTVIAIAGFASTIFMPLTGLLNQRYGWRTTLLILAAVYGAIAVPLHATVVRRPDSTLSLPARAVGAQRRRLVRAAVRDSRFWLLAVAFVAHAAAMSTMTVHLVGLLTHAGHPATFAATTAGLLGVLSVTGRLLLTATGRRLPLQSIVAAVITLQAAAAYSLALIGGSAIGAIAAVTVFGLGFGIAGLATPQLLADRYGTTAYASIAGILAAFVTLAKAGAPLAAAGLISAPGGYTTVLLAVGTACLTAACGLLRGRPDRAIQPAGGGASKRRRPLWHYRRRGPSTPCRVRTAASAGPRPRPPGWCSRSPGSRPPSG
jgi:MFS family permease